MVSRTSMKKCFPNDVGSVLTVGQIFLGEKRSTPNNAALFASVSFRGLSYRYTVNLSEPRKRRLRKEGCVLPILGIRKQAVT